MNIEQLPKEPGKYLCLVYDYCNSEARTKYGKGVHWVILHYNFRDDKFLGEQKDWPVLYWTYLPPIPNIVIN